MDRLQCKIYRAQPLDEVGGDDKQLSSVIFNLEEAFYYHDDDKLLARQIYCSPCRNDVTNKCELPRLVCMLHLFWAYALDHVIKHEH